MLPLLSRSPPFDSVASGAGALLTELTRSLAPGVTLCRLRQSGQGSPQERWGENSDRTNRPLKQRNRDRKANLDFGCC